MVEAEGAVRDLFAVYLDSYNRLDAEALVALHADPCVMVHRGEVFTIREDNSLTYHKTILQENADASEHVWEMASIDLEFVASNGATARLHWIARTPDGMLLWEDKPSYVVANDGDGWKIWSNISSNS